MSLGDDEDEEFRGMEASSGSVRSFSSFSSSLGGRARLSFELEALWLLRGVTTPAVYASDSFGMLGLRALFSVFENPFFHAAAAVLVGVFGSMGVDVSSSSLFLGLGCGLRAVEVVE